MCFNLYLLAPPFSPEPFVEIVDMAKMARQTSPQSSSTPSVSLLDLTAYPYLEHLETLRTAYPPLGSLLNKLRNYTDAGRDKVAQRYAKSSTFEGSPGRCAVITFHKQSVTHETFYHAVTLQKYLTDCPPSTPAEPRRRLFILEDLEPAFVDVLGQCLEVDPLVFSEQMNTWNFTDSTSVPHRALPSLRSPEKSFTLRYYEIRTMDDEDCIQTTKYQMTLAVNRRRIERWRDVDLPSIEPDKRHAFVRRCASFWTSKDRAGDSEGWDSESLSS